MGVDFLGVYIMKLNFVAASVIAATISPSLFAVENSESSNQLSDNLVITANRISQEARDVLVDIEVIDRAEIERIQPRSFSELLEGIAGIEVIRQGGHGQNASVFIRGATTGQTLFLIDGVRVGSATLGEKALSSISVAQIESIEIIRGPRAAVWGSDAIGGVIHIFTRRFETGENHTALTIGSNGESALESSVGFGSEKLTQTFTYAMRERDGIHARIGEDPDEDGSSMESYALRGDYQLGDISGLEWVLQKDRSNVEYDSSFGGDRSRTDTELFNIRYLTDISGWETAFSASLSKDENASFDQDVGYNDDSAFVTERTQLSAVTYKAFDNDLNLTLGADLYTDDVAESATVYAESERTTKSFWAGLNKTFNRFIVDATVRSDDVEGVDKQTTSNFALGYRLAEAHLFSLNFGEGFKAPSFNDLYFPWGGNPELQFETSDNLELLYKAQWNDSMFSAALYRSDVENLIQWIPTDGVWAPENVGEAKLQGATFDFDYRYGDYQHGFNLSLAEPEDKVTESRLIRRSRIQASYDLAYASESFSWSAQINHVGSRLDTGGKLPAYTRLNFSLGYAFNDSWSLNFKVNDALDKAPTEVFGYNPLGREYFLTITHKKLN